MHHKAILAPAQHLELQFCVFLKCVHIRACNRCGSFTLASICVTIAFAPAVNSCSWWVVHVVCMQRWTVHEPCERHLLCQSRLMPRSCVYKP